MDIHTNFFLHFRIDVRKGNSSFPHNIVCKKWTKVIDYNVLSKGKNGRPIARSMNELLGEKLQLFFNQMATYFYVVVSVEGPVV